MDQSVWDVTSRFNPKILSEIMYRTMNYENRFGKFIGKGFINAGGKAEEVGSIGDIPNFSGAPVDVFERFVTEGKTDMDIPVLKRLTDWPVYGDRPLEGTAEGAVALWRSVAINITRKAYKPPTGLSAQITKPYAEMLINRADNHLRTWQNDYFPGCFISAFLQGYSFDLLNSVTLGGRAKSVMSHPNLVVAGSGRVSYAGGRPGTAAYEAAVEDALNALTDNPTFYCTVDFIANLVAEAIAAKIKRVITKNGFEFYPIFMPDPMFRQLRQDPKFRDWAKRVPVDMEKNTLATGAEFYAEGAVVYPDIMLWGARTHLDDSNVTAGTVGYGPVPSAAEVAKGYKTGKFIQALDTNNKKCAILIGQSAASVGVGQKVKFTEDIKDHGMKREIGINYIQSVVRNDIFDADGQDGLTAGQFDENTSSLVAISYSPNTLKYN